MADAAAQSLRTKKIINHYDTTVPPGTYVTIFNIPNFEGMTGIIEKVLQNERGYDVRIMSVEHYGCTIFCTDADITSPTMKE